jgi:negative regulator of flagellin synthesis FlgM
MKIGNPAEQPSAPAPVAPNRSSATDATGKATAPAAPAAPQQAEASSTVALSTQATELLSGNKTVAGDFDAEKVERIAQAISDGKFEVNAPAIADKLLANAREVLGKAQH